MVVAVAAFVGAPAASAAGERRIQCPQHLVFYPMPIEKVIAAARRQIPVITRIPGSFIIDGAVSLRLRFGATPDVVHYRTIAERQCYDAAQASWAVIMEFPGSKIASAKPFVGFFAQTTGGLKFWYGTH